MRVPGVACEGPGFPGTAPGAATLAADTPEETDLRGNLHMGGTVIPAEVGELERRICATLRPALEALGIWFAGLDVIGDYLTEVNVTSPTGIQEANRLAGAKLETKVIELVEAKCRALGR